MKHFNSLKEGMSYRAVCPACHDAMTIDESYDVETNYEHTFHGTKTTLIWRHEQDEIEVDLETEEVKRHSTISNTTGYAQPIGYSRPH